VIAEKDNDNLRLEQENLRREKENAELERDKKRLRLKILRKKGNVLLQSDICVNLKQLILFSKKNN